MVAESSNTKNNDFTILKWVGIFGVITLSVCVIGSIILLVAENLLNWPGTYDLQRIGSWGDAFGGFLNPIFSFLALIGLLWTIKYQAEQLKVSSDALKHSAEELTLTREELELTRKELSGSRKASQAVARAADRQNIENAFFQLLNLLNGIVENAEVGEHKGTRAFHTIADSHLMHLCRIHTTAPKESSSRDQRINAANDVFDRTYSSQAAILGHYFRVLYSILRFLSEKKEEIGVEMFSTYVKIFRGNLSDFELVLLFYNCLSNRGNAMEKYAREFGLFDNINSAHFKRHVSPNSDLRDFLLYIDAAALGENQKTLLEFARSK